MERFGERVTPARTRMVLEGPPVRASAHPLLERPEAARLLDRGLGLPERADLAQYLGRLRRADAGEPGDRQRDRRGAAALSALREREAFLAYHYCARELAAVQRDYAAARGRAARDAALRRGRRWLARAEAARNRIAEWNVGIVVDIAARRARGRPDEPGALTLGEATAAGNAALLRAVETFDPATGNKFSTYAAVAVERALAKARLQEARRRAASGSAAPRADDDDEPDAMARLAERPDDSRMDAATRELVELLRETMARNDAGLSWQERNVLRERWGVSATGARAGGGAGTPHREVGRRCRITGEAARLAEQSALAKLRALLEARLAV